MATIAMCGPSCLLSYRVARVWDRRGDAPWRKALADGLSPVTVGLVSATAWLLAKTADHDLKLAVVTLATGAVAYGTRLNPLWCLAAAACLGFAGVL